MVQPPTASATTPASPPHGGPRPSEVMIIAGTTLAIVTVGFAVLARLYYVRKLRGDFGGDPVADAAAGAVAWEYVKATYFWSFATFSIVGTAAITAAVLWPREVGHGMAAAFGTAFVIAGTKILATSPMPPLVGIMVAGIGGLMLALTWTSWRERDRAAWAFLLALAATLTVVMFFGTPRIRATLEVDRQWYVILLPALMSSIAVACYRSRKDYA